MYKSNSVQRTVISKQIKIQIESSVAADDEISIFWINVFLFWYLNLSMKNSRLKAIERLLW